MKHFGKTLLMSAIFVLSAAASATGSHNPPPPTPPPTPTPAPAPVTTLTQGQSQKAIAAAAARATATANAIANQRQAQAQRQAQGQKQGQSTENANNASQAVVVNGDTYNQRRQPVNTAYAAGLVGGPCTGSASGGIQTSGIGISLGGTSKDEDCNMRNNAAMLVNLGQADAAVMLMCGNDAIREAMTAVGRRCSEGGRKVRQDIQPVFLQTPVPVEPPVVPVAPAKRVSKLDRG